jgi:glycerophosphoryl diester phosphodiesterase
MRPWNIAHRGGAALKPENTLAAFADAVARGADGAELDVQLTRDGEVVVFHDNRLKPDICRDGNGEWLVRPTPKIVDLTFAELRTYDVGRARPGSAYAATHPDLVPVDGERIPLLSEVIETAKRAAKPFHLFVELKTSFVDRSLSAPPDVLAEATIGVLRAHDYLDRSILVGFDWPGLLHAMKSSQARAAGSPRWRKAGFATGRRLRKTIHPRSRRLICCVISRARANRPGQAVSMP